MRIDVRKTPKLFINGAFVRSESGRTLPIEDDGRVVNVARASRKDVRDAVRAARAAQRGWAERTAYNRGQILYRLAEMMETRRSAFATSAREIDASIDRIVWYAGWCDKIEQYLSTKNPVAGPHFNVSAPEPTGVVGLIAPVRPALLGLVSTVAPALCGANAVVAVIAAQNAGVAVAFAEAVASSDFPPGIVNVLTGDPAELAPHLARHMDVNGLGMWYGDDALRKNVAILAADNVKRLDLRPQPAMRSWFAADAQSPHRIATWMEIKTVWHPAGV